MDDADRFVEQVEKAVLDLLRAQIDWHQRHGLVGDWKRLASMSERLVAEKIDRLTEKQDRASIERLADSLDAIRVEILPKLIQRLRERG
jgi:hypothetical protein